MVVGRGEEFADGVGFGIQEGGTAEFVAQDLVGVLGEAVGEAAEGFVEGGGLECVCFVVVVVVFIAGGCVVDGEGGGW